MIFIKAINSAKRQFTTDFSQRLESFIQFSSESRKLFLTWMLKNVPYFPHALSALSTAVFYLVVDLLQLKLLSSPHLLNSADLLVYVQNESTKLPPSLK